MRQGYNKSWRTGNKQCYEPSVRLLRGEKRGERKKKRDLQPSAKLLRKKKQPFTKSAGSVPAAARDSAKLTLEKGERFRSGINFIALSTYLNCGNAPRVVGKLVELYRLARTAVNISQFCLNFFGTQSLSE